ncbi:hypothetical protein NE235_15300 [Actinoallomurus spadix]|uniref:PE domain-containing protein n=1 Tax=Actinoallomurus spadix TaxID=79912 RepID=A0ABP3FJN7_9ACTN|nr:hypothetical protein [Actinoallomurus spadix]MCO5987468.1 hypothetical protein [Actinoallomurus spadix]
MPPLNEGGTQRGAQYPKLWVGGGAPDVKWEPSKIGHAAAILENALENFAATGAINKLQAHGRLTAAELGNWDAGQALAGTTQAAHEHITAVAHDLILQYAAVIQLLQKTAAGYSGTEQKLAEHARQIGGRRRPTSATDPTWHNVPSAD